MVRLNPATDEITVWRNPLGPEPIIALAIDDQFAYIGSDLSANGLPTKPGDGQFGVIDLASGATIFATHMEGREGVRPIGAIRADDNTRLVLLPTADGIDVFDVDTLAFRTRIDEATIGTPDSPGYGEDILTTKDGALLFSRGQWLVKITRDLGITQFGPLPWTPNHMTFGADGAIYACNGPTLYRIDIV